MLVLWTVCAVSAQEYTISPATSRVEAIVEKTGVMSGKKHLLRWEKFSGKFTLMPPQVMFEAESATVSVLDDWVNGGQKEDIRKETIGKDVLDAAKHPVVRFVSTAATDNTLTGNLTVRGVTKPVTLRFKKNADGTYDGESSFPMTQFGIKPPKAALGLVGTNDEMTIRVHIAPEK
jgi:polyisoprenoid-binding protein YceI